MKHAKISGLALATLAVVGCKSMHWTYPDLVAETATTDLACRVTLDDIANGPRPGVFRVRACGTEAVYNCHMSRAIRCFRIGQ